MKACRETDAKVAVVVMGWRWVKTTGVDKRRREHPDKFVFLLPPDEAARYLPAYVRNTAPVEGPQHGYPDRLPCYSSDPAAMWLVIEKMREDKVAFVLGANGWHNQWTAWFNDGIWALGKRQNEVPRHGDLALLGCATADSAPLAVCLAALAAKSEQRPEG